ncbi:MAG: hypothetical protein K0U72_13485 [Gammaproteobacteria bacterium]|nr:hypothetical protein [Gammaproteobacteria bacterium]
MTSRSARVAVTTAIVAASAVVIVALIWRDKPVDLPESPPAQVAESDSPALARLSQEAAPTSHAAEVVESGTVVTQVDSLTKADAFDALMKEGMASGGEALVRAFDIHDSCLAVPRSQNALDAWYADNASQPDTNYDRMKQRTRECIGVPLLTFETRRDILRPLAESGDVATQFLLGTTYPYTFEAHRRWLRKSAEGGYARAMVLLAQSLAEQAQSETARPEAYRWLTLASDMGHSFAASERDVLESQMTLGELRLARSDQTLSTDELLDLDWSPP